MLITAGVQSDAATAAQTSKVESKLLFAPGPQPAKVEGCAAIPKAPEEAASPDPWTLPQLAQVGRSDYYACVLIIEMIIIHQFNVYANRPA